jgi:tungstate transport system ATP-binding protein
VSRSDAAAPRQEILPLELDAICYQVAGRALVKSVSTRFEAGPRSVILGPNGAGKSLTLRMAHGLLDPSSGSVRWRGPAGHQARAHQAMVFERSVLLRRSAAANVDYALSLRGMPRAQRRQRVAEVLERTGLTALASRPARVLSAGEQQRLALARAWAGRPEVLFLDEPTAALDPGATRSVETLIEAIAADGTKVVMTTHDLGQARRLAEEVLFMHKGELLEHSQAKQFFEKPESAAAAAFLDGELIG